MFSLVLATSGSLVRVGLANCVRHPARGAECPEADGDLNKSDSSGLSWTHHVWLFQCWGNLRGFCETRFLATEMHRLKMNMEASLWRILNGFAT
jgi:hypothetical protein